MRQPGDRAPAPEALTLVQDFVNTVDIEMERDNLRSASDLATFCAAHGLDGLTFDEADVAECRRFREALRDVCQAHTGAEVPGASMSALDDLLRRAPIALAIDARGGARPVPAAGVGGLSALVAHLACDILTAAADGTWPRLKACTAHECRWVYYDHSPAGRGRWCTMTICGSRAKMRAYRGRMRPAGRARQDPYAE